MPEALVDLAVEDLVALRVLVALLESRHGFGRLAQLRLVRVRGGLVAARLVGVLQHMERLPAAEHVRVGRDVVRIGEACAILVYAYLLSAAFVEIGLPGPAVSPI